MSETTETSGRSSERSEVYASLPEAALWFLLPGMLQGIALWVLGELFDETAPDPLVVAAILAIVVAPVAHFLTTTRATRLPALIYSTGLGLTVAALYWLTVVTSGLTDLDSHGDVFAMCLFSSFLISWITAPFFRTMVERRGGLWDYADLFEFAWNLPVIGIVGVFFTGVFWLVLAVWAGLFDLIGIDFFSDIFFTDWLGLPMTAGAFAVATGIVRERESIVLALRSILFALLKVLAPVLAFATALFAVAALVNGLDALWDNWSATAVMVAAMAGAVIFSNAVAGVEGEPDHAILRWSVRLQSVVLPVLGGFAVYGLWLRIGEYGLTVERVWAAIIVFVACAYALAYCVCAILPAGWALFRKTNIVLALGLLALAVLVQTPVIDPFSWSARDQVARLKGGDVTPEAFDYAYLKFELGRAGEKALARIAEDESLPHHDYILEQVAAVSEAGSRHDYVQGVTVTDRSVEAAIASGDLLVLPAGTPLAPDFVDVIRYNLTAEQCFNERRRCAVLVTDQFNGPSPQYIFLDGSWTWLNATLYLPERTGDGFVTLSSAGRSFDSNEELRAWFDQLEETGFEMGTITLRTIETGAGDLRFMPSDDAQVEILAVPAE